MRKETISRKEFLKRAGVFSAATVLASSKLANLGEVKAAVIDNTDSEDISNSIIYNVEEGTNPVFTSGQKIKDLAAAVNDINKSYFIKE